MRSRFSAKSWLVALGILCLPLLGRATPISALNLKALTDASDFVIVGETGQGVDIGESQIETGAGVISVRNVEVQVDVKSIIKGHGMPSKILVRFPHLLPPGGSIGLDGVPGDQDRLLFLKVSDIATEYAVTSPYHPSIPAISPASKLASDPLVAVSEVECAVIMDRESEIGYRLQAIWALRSINEPCIASALRTVGKSEASEALRITAQAELLMRNDLLLIDSSIQEILAPDDSFPESLRQNLIVAIRDGVRDPSSIDLLAKLVKNSDEDLRIAAVHALKNIGRRQCAPALLLSLSDNNQEVRYTAAAALADIYGLPQLHPSIPEFRINENKYISYWQNAIHEGEPQQ